MKYIFILPLFAFSFLSATPPWNIDDLRNFQRSYERYEQSKCDAEYIPPVPTSYPKAMNDACSFVAYWQLYAPDSIEHGGIIEAETGELRDVIQTDNTQESVLIWSMYKDLFSSAKFDSCTYLSWDYISRFPAYNEETSAYSFYYPVWNSGLGMLSVVYYTQSHCDSSFIRYGDSCAAFVIDSVLPLYTPEPLYNLLHCFVTAFVAGALSQYGDFRDNIYYLEQAESLAVRAMNWADANPTTGYDSEIWAMSSGTVVWGLVHSYFRNHPDEVSDWINDYIYIYLPDMAPPAGSFDPYIWDNSWNIWYANGYRALADIAPDTLWYYRYRSLVDYLIQQDTDDDGGIPSSAAHGDTMDMSWVTTYLVFMGLEGIWNSLLEYDAGATELHLLETARPYHIVGDTFRFSVEITNCGTFNLSDAFAYFICDGDTLFEQNCSLNLGMAKLDTLIWIPSTAGEHIIEWNVSTAGDTNIINDTLSMHIYITPISSVNGYLVDSTGAFIDCELSFFSRYDSIIPIAITCTDSTTHYFHVMLPELIYRVCVSPDFPFPMFYLDSVNSAALPSEWVITALYPQILLVENDDGAYDEYFTSAIDNLDISFALWDRRNGEILLETMEPFRWKTLLWFSGDKCDSTLSNNDMNTLAEFIDSGGTVILSGQYIAEDIMHTSFWDSYIGAEVSSNSEAILVYDIYGEARTISTCGTGSASNQISLDWMTIPSDAEAWVVQNTEQPDTNILAFHRTIGAGRMFFSSLGFEGIGMLYPMCESRTEFLEKILDWANPTSIFTNGKSQIPDRFALSIYPNPFNSSCIIALNAGNTCANPEMVEIFDLCGNVVGTGLRAHNDDNSAIIPNGEYTDAPLHVHTFIWHPSESTPSGVYLVRATLKKQTTIAKVAYIK